MRIRRSQHLAGVSTAALLALAFELSLAGCQLSGGQPAPANATPPPVPTFPTLTAPSSASSAHGASAIQPHLNGVPAFTTQDMAQYITSHPLPGAGGAPTITLNVFLPSQQVVQRIGVPVGRAAATMVGYVELRGSFRFPNLLGGMPFTYSSAYEVFDAQTGNLLLYGGLRAQPTSTPVPTATPEIPTPTATPASSPQLSVTPSGTTNITCGALPLTYPTVTVRNSGGATLTWQVVATNSHVAVSPTSGSLGAERSQTLSVSQTSGGAGTDLKFSSNGGSATISFVCIPG